MLGGGGGGAGSVRQSWSQPVPGTGPASHLARDAAAAAASETRPPFVEQPVTEISDQELAALGFPIEDGAAAAAAAAPDSGKDGGGGGGGGGVIDSPFIHFTSRELLFRSSSLVLSLFSVCPQKVFA